MRRLIATRCRPSHVEGKVDNSRPAYARGSEVTMDNASTALPPFIEQYRDWRRGSENPWRRLQQFVEQMADRLRVRDLGGCIQTALPEDPPAVAELCYWHGQWILGMCPTRICENTVPIARACRAFLLACELCPEILGAGMGRVFEELLGFTHLVENTLLMDLPAGAKSLRLESLTESIYDSCERLPWPEAPFARMIE